MTNPTSGRPPRLDPAKDGHDHHTPLLLLSYVQGL
jgi:hypothetical protein